MRLKDVLPKQLSSTAIVFAVTLVGYLSTYLFELGYLKYYRIDQNLIQISPVQIIVGAAAGLAVAMILYLVVVAYKATIAKLDDKNVEQRYKREKVTYSYFFTGTLVWALISFAMRNENVGKALLIIAGIFPLAYWVTYMSIKIRYRNKKTWEKQLKSYFKKLDEKTRKNKRKETEAISDQVAVIVLGLLLLCFGSYCVGYLSARPSPKQEMSVNLSFVPKPRLKEYGVINTPDGKKEVIIRGYGELLIVKEYDAKTKKLSNDFSTKSSTGLTVSMEELELKD